MRWIWIDRFLEFHSGKRAVAVKCISMAEEHLHDHMPGFPVMPASLIIEAMAQTAGILVGEAGKFQQKVILAKIRRAIFYDLARPGECIELEAILESYSPEAASTSGTVRRAGQVIANIDLLFSHLDQNLSGIPFPRENFVFEKGPIQTLMTTIVCSDQIGLAENG
ncbi:MAG: 3-hydroxyacyl-ACP dehydratase FabZ family protein [Sedimentisphaerales bacterium]|nr:3-hydroxyacyl-ACP dehydratase FabZ family protein [Sedimentisphaerales bacterium]